MSGFLRGFTGVLGALAVGAVTAYGVAMIVDGTPVTEKTREVGGLLRTANRDHLAICVDAVDVANRPAIQALAVTSVQDAVNTVMEHPDWAKVARAPGLAQAPAEIVSGCVSPPVALDLGAGPVFTEFVVDHVGRSVDEASPYLFHVYILPAEEILRIVGPSENYHWGAEELICYGDNCSPVTWGLYFSPKELEDPDLIAREIEFVIGLR